MIEKLIAKKYVAPQEPPIIQKSLKKPPKIQREVSLEVDLVESKVSTQEKSGNGHIVKINIIVIYLCDLLSRRRKNLVKWMRFCSFPFIWKKHKENMILRRKMNCHLFYESNNKALIKV